jgi:hypothetical protein
METRLPEGLVVSSTTHAIRFVIRPAAWHGIARSTPRLRILSTAIETSRRQTASMNSFFKNASDLLRKRSVFGSRTAAKGFLQMVRNVCTYENAFAISHLSALESCEIDPANTEQVCKPNSVLRSKSKWRSFI